MVFNSDSELVFSLRSKRLFFFAFVFENKFCPVTDIPAPESTVVHQFPIARILTT